jgi:uncharacterized protein (TIGR00369 family)
MEADRPEAVPRYPLTVPLEPAQRAELTERWNRLLPMRHLGARGDFSDPEAVRVIVDPIQEFHRGGLGTSAVNGAVIAGLCDAAVGMVGHVHTQGRRGGTAQLNVMFIRPVMGNRVTAVGRLTRAGANLIFVAVEVEDERGVVCARCDGILAVSPRPAAGTDVAL